LKRLVGGFLLGVALATLVFLLVRVMAPHSHEAELAVYLLVVGSIALLSLVLATRTAYPPDRSMLAAALAREPPGPSRPAELERLEREVTLATTTAFDLHYRLRPTLREIALQRLADRHNVALDAGGPEVEAALGEELWELVRPDREPPVVRYAPGLPPPAVQRIVERLEAL
jgi:hypothetical protein